MNENRFSINNEFAPSISNQKIKPKLVKVNTLLNKFASIDATKYLYKFAVVQGVQVPETYKIPYIIYSLIWNFLANIYLPIAFVIGIFNVSAAELQIGNLLTSFQVTFDVYAGAFKIIYLAFFIHKLRLADPVLERLDKRCKEPDEIAEIENVVRFGRICVMGFATAYFSYSASTFLGAVIMGHPPYSLYFPYINWRHSKSEFVVASIIEHLMMDQACVQQVVNDSYAVIYVRILRTHVNILLLRLQKLSTNKALSLEQNYEELKLCIKDHKALIELYDIISPIISVTMFIQLMITASILGTTLINIMIFATDFTTRVGSCFYILAVITQSFPLCYQAQCLLDESSRLAEVILHSNWIEQNVQYRKLLIFFIQRSQRSMQLTAGKIIPITLNSFLSIAKFSFTLYTFIKEMNIKEKFGLE
ncbi:odorant receptor 7a-like [Teleopsis dalmanni]|uniref:odorant receptor 7a-like n=1 Tax=Teleopsis dalmanni TaxID=139649 RepID=UPI0018CC9092|nr:odorant receptor 7a-like [Teleopsis dalmanni]